MCSDVHVCKCRRVIARQDWAPAREALERAIGFDPRSCDTASRWISRVRARAGRNHSGSRVRICRRIRRRSGTLGRSRLVDRCCIRPDIRPANSRDSGESKMVLFEDGAKPSLRTDTIAIRTGKDLFCSSWEYSQAQWRRAMRAINSKAGSVRNRP